MLRPSFPTGTESVEPDGPVDFDQVVLEDQIQHGLEIISALEALEALNDDDYIALETIFHQVATEGISRDDYNTIEAISPGTLSCINPNRLTAVRSLESTTVALEAIDWKKAGIIAVVVAAVAGLLAKLIKWLSDKMGSKPSEKMAERVAKTIDKIYERTALADLSESYNRKNPWKGGTKEFDLYEKLMLANSHEDFDTLPFIEVIAAAMVTYQSKVKIKNFPTQAVMWNMDYLINAMRAAKQEHNYDKETLTRILQVTVGNFLANNKYNAMEHHLITEHPARNIFSELGVHIAYVQYQYFFKIAERYELLMNDFTFTVLNTFLPEPVDKLNYEQNASRYKRYVNDYINELYRGTTAEVARKTSNAYTKLENKLFDIWIEFQEDPEVEHLKKMMAETGSTALFLFDTNQLHGLSTERRNPNRATFTQRSKGQTAGPREDILINPSPSGMNADETKHMYRTIAQLKHDMAQGAVYNGMVFNLAEYFNERGRSKIVQDGASEGLHLMTLHKYGINKESEKQLQSSHDAIVRVRKLLVDGNFATRLDRVSDSMANSSAMFEDWKTSFDGRFNQFITETGNFDNDEPLSKIGFSQMGRSRINIDVTMKAIFTSIRTVAGVLADHTKYLNGMEVHALRALQKRSNAANEWNKFEKSGILDKIGKKK